MTQSTAKKETGELGYLTVRVSTASGAIPLENASVTIRGGDISASSVIYALRTNSDGLTPTVSLPAPPLSASQAPQYEGRAYEVYNVEVWAEGYIPAFFQNVPVFPAINSIQPAVLVPHLENKRYDAPRVVTESGNSDIGGEIYDG